MFFFNFDLSKLRWLQATKSIISGTNTQALTAKADLLKEEMDESMNKVEQCKVTSTIDDVAPVFQQMLLLHHQPGHCSRALFTIYITTKWLVKERKKHVQSFVID